MKLKNDTVGVSPVVGVILMVAITVILAAVVVVLVMDMANESVEVPPMLSMTQLDNGDYMVVSASNGLTYEEISVSECDDHKVTGQVTAGDLFVGCGEQL